MRRRQSVVLGAFPAPLVAFDPREWGWPGPRLDGSGYRTQGNLDAFGRFLAARIEWEAEHPDVDLPEVPVEEYLGDVAWSPA